MANSIITPELMRERGRDAAKAVRPRNSHGMHWGAPALQDWLAGYDEEMAFERCHPAAHELGRIDGACLCAASEMLRAAA